MLRLTGPDPTLLLVTLLAAVLAAYPAAAGDAAITFKERNADGCDVYEITSEDNVTFLAILESNRPTEGLEIDVDKGFVFQSSSDALSLYHLLFAEPTVTLTVCPKGNKKQLDYRVVVWTADDVKPRNSQVLEDLSDAIAEPRAGDLLLLREAQTAKEGSDRYEATYSFFKDGVDCSTARTVAEENVEEVNVDCRSPANLEDLPTDVEVEGRIVDPKKEAFVAVTVDPAGTIVQMNTVIEPEPDTLDDCRFGPRPSATLLFPYFEVDLDASATTLVSVVNDAEECTLTRATLWTDWGVPTLTFYVYLSPGDVQTINLRDIFNGQLPRTSVVMLSPECPVLDFDICDASELDMQLTAEEAASLRADHVGSPNPLSGDCASSDRGDLVARGYMTVDTVHTCTLPPTVDTSSAAEWTAPEGYFSATQTATTNHLWGDFFFVDPANNFAHGEAAVHIPADPDRFQPGEFTFYGRYTGFDGSDGRVPLSSRFKARFLDGGPFDGGARILVWRSDRQFRRTRLPCGQLPAGLPLGTAGATIFDENEQEVPLEGLDQVCLEEAGTLAFACTVKPDLVDPIPFGYLTLDLGLADGTPAQASVISVMSAQARFSVGYGAVATNTLCDTPAPEDSP